jgi:hypothetical protein
VTLLLIKEKHQNYTDNTLSPIMLSLATQHVGTSRGKSKVLIKDNGEIR